MRRTFLTHILDHPTLSEAAVAQVRGELSRFDAEIPSDSLETGTSSNGSTQASGIDGATEIDPDEPASDLSPPDRTETSVSRIVRNTKIAKKLKQVYDYRCQVCGEQRKRDEEEPYAEAHHVHPLGNSPPGVDHTSNILILCPNHHADFDYGTIEVDPETLEIRHAYEEHLINRELLISDDHHLDRENIRYHNSEVSVV